MKGDGKGRERQREGRDTECDDGKMRTSVLRQKMGVQVCETQNLVRRAGH